MNYYEASTLAFAILAFIWMRSSWLNIAIKFTLYALAVAGLFEALQARGILINL